jgi:DNA replication protein DnaC
MVLAQFKPARVNIDYHVAFEGHYYSVPHQHVGAAVELRITASTLEVLLRRQRIAAHARNARVGGFTTVAEHMPASHRAHRQWTPAKLKAARLKVSSACIEDIDWRAGRGLDRHLVTALAEGDWIRHGRNILITGATGCGKTWLGCALAQQAARQGFSVLYTRATRLLQELQVAHGDGSFSRRLAQLARLDVLVLDDLAIAPIAAQERQDLLELLDDRVGCRSTLITSQLPAGAWHQWLDEPTIADAIMDRLLHGTHTIALKGESMRRARPQA